MSQKNSVSLGDLVRVRQSHWLKEARGRIGTVSVAPSGVLKDADGTFSEVRSTACGSKTNFVWVEFQCDGTVGEIDAGMIPEADLERV